MNITRTVAADELPISLATARAWLSLQVGLTQDDDVITEVITETVEYLERRLNGRKLVTQTYKVELDADEIVQEIRLPLVPVIAVTSIVATDDDGAETVVDSSNYQLRPGEDPRIVLTASGAWPGTRAYDGLAITVTVGYGAAEDIPADLLALVKDLVLFRYSTKGTGVQETVSGQLISIPVTIEKQVASLRLESWR